MRSFLDLTRTGPHYTDVKAAQINPLTHVPQHGIDENRPAFANGMWA